jgi:DNA-binding transcriptional ArsR family regulator
MHGKPSVSNEDTGSQVSSSIPPNDTIDNLFHALSHPIRRDILRYLIRQDDSIGLNELAATLAEPNPACEIQSTDSAQIAVTLTHRHLPLLADLGLIEDESPETVTATDETHRVTLFLELSTACLDHPRL